MRDATTKFFEAMDRQGHDPLLEKVVGTTRIDLTEADKIDHWLISVDRGDITVSREARQDVDAVVTSDAGLFDRAVLGEVNVFSALLRGAILVQGDLRLVLRMERLLPGPANARGPRHLPAGAREGVRA